MTPTPEEAKAEMERRKENRARKAKGEKPVTAPHSELTMAGNAELKAWAEAK